MSRKLVLAMTLITFSLIGMLSVAIRVQKVKASITITIKVDGSVDPSTANITSSDNITYYFTDNNYGEIVVERNNIIIDGMGYFAEGNGTGRGFNLQSTSNVTIKNTSIRSFAFGIYLSLSSNSKILGNNITNNNDGVGIFSSSDNTLSGNSIIDNANSGIGLDSSSNDILTGNAVNGSEYNFFIRGVALSHFTHSIDVSNLVDGKPIYYLVNQKDLQVNPVTHSQVGYLGLINSVNVTVEDLTLTDNWQGLLFAYTNNSKIIDNNVTSNFYGVWFSSSFGNTISGNSITNNNDGIRLFSSSNNSLYGNNITNNINNGIKLDSSSNNTVSENSVTNNKIGVEFDSSPNNSIYENNIAANSFYGIELSDSSNHNSIFGNNIAANNVEGIYLYMSSNNSIFGNNITANNLDGILLEESSDYNDIFENQIANNGVGIYLDFSSNYNNIFQNSIKDNSFGIELGESSNNKFFHNSFVNNTMQVDIFISDYANLWDDGYPSGGNYWSDHSLVDSNRDGIGDSGYAIDSNNTDNYPLMGMFSSFNTSAGYNVDVISNSTVGNLEYFESNSSIRMYVSNASSNQSFGFIRMRIPKVLMFPPYTVTIDDGIIEVLYFNDTIYDTATHRWIYFAYEHSTRKVVVQGFPPDSIPPSISILSPENKTYNVNEVPLTFTVNELTSWIGYSLDGQANVTITGNTTLSGLTSGLHSLIVYSNDTAGNTGASETIYFSISTQQVEPSLPTFEWLIIVIIIIGIVGAIGFALYKIVRQDEEST